MRKLKDWYESYLAYSLRWEAPPLYKEWCAVAAISTALERKVWLEWHDKIAPNMFIILVGPPSVGKGTAMKPTKELLSTLTDVYILPDSITYEQMLLRCAEQQTTFDYLDGVYYQSPIAIWAEELITLISKDPSKSKFIPNLCDLYEMKDFFRNETKTSGIDDIVAPNVVLVAGTTPDLLQTSVPVELIGGGFVSRAIFVYGGRDDRCPPVAFPKKTKIERELQADLQADLHTIHSLAGEMQTTPEWEALYEPWHTDNHHTLAVNDPHFLYYNGRRRLHLLKLCMIFSAIRGDDLQLTDVDFLRAIDLLKRTEHKMPKVFNSKSEANKVDILHRMQAYLMEEKRVYLAQLQRVFLSNLDAHELMRMLQALQNAQYVKVVTGKEGQKIIIWQGPTGGKDE